MADNSDDLRVPPWHREAFPWGRSLLCLDPSRAEPSVEDLYQAFKERLMAELVADVRGVPRPHFGLLVDRSK